MNVYPDLIERIKAVFVDMLVLIFLMFMFSTVFSYFEHVPNEVRIGAFVFIFLLYDPIFTSFLGGTIGHMIIGIRVKQSEHKEKNINFFAALLRFLCKSSLGWISLLTVSGHKEKKAMHDSLVGSVVVYG
jgi:uncharacterized RDD family membrane protein YckC